MCKSASVKCNETKNTIMHNYTILHAHVIKKFHFGYTNLSEWSDDQRNNKQINYRTLQYIYPTYFYFYGIQIAQRIRNNNYGCGEILYVIEPTTGMKTQLRFLLLLRQFSLIFICKFPSGRFLQHFPFEILFPGKYYLTIGKMSACHL